MKDSINIFIFISLNNYIGLLSFKVMVFLMLFFFFFLYIDCSIFCRWLFFFGLFLIFLVFVFRESFEKKELIWEGCSYLLGLKNFFLVLFCKDFICWDILIGIVFLFDFLFFWKILWRKFFILEEKCVNFFVFFSVYFCWSFFIDEFFIRVWWFLFICISCLEMNKLELYNLD